MGIQTWTLDVVEFEDDAVGKDCSFEKVNLDVDLGMQMGWMWLDLGIGREVVFDRGILDLYYRITFVVDL